MAISDLSKDEQQVILECLTAAAKGPFFPDWEFHILFGLYRQEVRQVVDDWPNVNEDSEEVVLAINNSINNLLGYPHGRQDVWQDYISVTPKELGVIFAKWRQASVPNYFYGMM